MRISKKTREQAALMCQVRASQWASGDAPDISGTAEMLGLERESEDLARAAFVTANSGNLDGGWRFCVEEWAEAEAMLRTGWSPT